MNHNNSIPVANPSQDKLRLSFTQAANSLTAFYKESVKAQSEAYLEGQIDALNEILDFSLKKYNGDIRNIPTTSLMEFLNSKIMELNNKKSNEGIPNIFSNNCNTMQNGFMGSPPTNDNMRFNMNSQYNNK